jgi:hypothetical protein
MSASIVWPRALHPRRRWRRLALRHQQLEGLRRLVARAGLQEHGDEARVFGVHRRLAQLLAFISPSP